MKHQRIFAVISLLCIAAVLCSGCLKDLPIAGGDGGDSDAHAGHNHAVGEDCNASTANTNTTTNPDTDTAKVKYHVYTNADTTYHLVIRDSKNAILFEADKLPKIPVRSAVNEEAGVYELGWATGTGANDFECVYYNEQTGQVSQQFHAPRGTDGVRIVYGSEDQTKAIAQDLFDETVYRKEYTLEGAYSKDGTIIIGGSLQSDNKTVVVSYYINAEGQTHRAYVDMYR